MQVMDMVTHPHNAYGMWTLQLDVGKKHLLDTETSIYLHKFKLIGCKHGLLQEFGRGTKNCTFL